MLSDQGFVQYVKKCPLEVFLGAKSKGLLLQNHANRRVHPSKIEGALPMAYVFQKGFLEDTFCSAKAYFGGFKLYAKSWLFATSYELLILDCLGVVWVFNLDPFWRA